MAKIKKIKTNYVGSSNQRHILTVDLWNEELEQVLHLINKLNKSEEDL